MRLQFPYLPNNFNLWNDTKVQLTLEMKPNENHVDYNVNGTIEAPRIEYDSNHQGWTSTLGPCVVHVLLLCLMSICIPSKFSSNAFWLHIVALFPFVLNILNA